MILIFFFHCLVCYGQGLGVRVPTTSISRRETSIYLMVRGASIFFSMGSEQNLEKSGGFAWRRGGVLPLLRSGSCRGARRRNSLSILV